MKKILFIAIIFVPFLAFAQAPDYAPNIIPLAPNSKGLEMFGDYEINQFTGTADISIPIYTIQAGDLQVPITLKYNSSGIRVQDVASWVGLGWSLDAGYDITRRTRGLEDERSTYGYLTGSTLKSVGYDYDEDDSGDFIYMHNAATTTWDTEPDIFSYRTMGTSGKFFFDGQDDLAIKKIPYSPVKIEKLSGGTNSIYFDITDEYGNFYEYGNSTASKELCELTPTWDVVNGWKINTLISADKRDTISFSYTDQTANISYPSSKILFYDMPNYDALPYVSSGEQSTTLLNNYRSSKEQLPDEIVFPDGKVKFVRSSGYRQDVGAYKYLDEIEVYSFNYADQDYDLQQTTKFYYSYFSSTRLRLDSIRVYEGDLTTLVDSYSFDYNTSPNLPSRTSYKVDKWGYYNGVSGKDSYIPLTTVYYINDGGSPASTQIGGNMNASSYYAQANILKKIHFPTGGYTEFEYESNQYTDGGGTHLVGGLRIKSIKSYTATGATPVTKTYEYNDQEVLYNDKDYVYWSEYYNFDQDIAYPDIAFWRITNYYSSPVSDNMPYDGAIIVYPKVTEYMGTSTTNTGKNVYTFNVSYDLDNTNYYWEMAAMRKTSYFFDRGQLTEKKVYANNSGSYYPVSRTSFTYDNSGFDDSTYYDVGFLCQYLSNDTYYHTLYNLFRYLTYDIVSDDNLMASKTERIYNQDDTTKYVETVTSYDYDNFVHQQVSDVTTTNSDGDTKVTYYKYPADYTSVTEGWLKTMTDQNIQAIPIETYTKVNSKTIAAQLNLYQSGGYSTVVPEHTMVLETETPLSSFTPSNASYNSVMSTKDSNYASTYYVDYNYNTSNNLLKDYTPIDGEITTVVWGYDNTKLVLVVEGGISYTALNGSYGSLITYLQNNSNLPMTSDYSTVKTKVDAIKNLTTMKSLYDNPLYQPTLYTYCPNVGITSITGPDRVTTYYEYDNLGRLINTRNDDQKVTNRNAYNYVTGN